MKSYRVHFLTALCLAVSAIAAPTLSRAGAPITTDVSPPPPRIENVTPRDGFVWAPGYWEWNRRSYHWVTGSYIYQRRRYHWVADRWEQVGGRWHYLSGRWERTEASAGLLSSAEMPVKAR